MSNSRKKQERFKLRLEQGRRLFGLKSLMFGTVGKSILGIPNLRVSIRDIDIFLYWA
jgi:hypothetical protein